jgi:hypothetical protein
MIEEYEAIEYAIALLPAVRQCVDEAISDRRRAAKYARTPRRTTEQAIEAADRIIAENVAAAGERAKARCLAPMARGERIDSDAVFAAEMRRAGMPATGAALYKRRREYPTERQIDQAVRSDLAKAECDAIRAGGGRPDTDAIYRKHCG